MQLLPKKTDFKVAAAVDGGSFAEAARASRDSEAGPVVVVGGGPSGFRVAEELTRRGLPVVLFNGERWRPYNRIKLTPFLAGDIQIEQVHVPAQFLAGAPVKIYTDHWITRIDRETREVVNRHGRRWRYSKLVLCIGSHPFVPNIEGKDLSGVYTFRDLDDAEKLMSRSFRARKAVIIGGGLLGLEAARGMSRRGVTTTVVEHESRLMAKQFDKAGGDLLADYIRALGITVHTGTAVRSIDGETRVEGVTLGDRTRIPCDTVIICTGVRSNIDLARDAGLAVGQGIRVDDAMRTSDPDIYAVGECAQHNDIIYGLVGPGLEQASVAAAGIAGKDAAYAGSVTTTKLKVIGVDVFCSGDTEQTDQRIDIKTVVHSDPNARTYRRLIVDHGRLTGVISLGAWPETSRVQQAIVSRARIWPWQRRRFARTGRLWPEEANKPVTAWAPAAVVCNCTGVTRGRLGEAISAGCISLEALRHETSANTVCGSCQPLLLDLLGGVATAEPVKWFRAIGILSLLAALAAIATLIVPAWPYSQSVQNAIRVDLLWIDSLPKQISGFTLLGLGIGAAVLSLRKRIRGLSFGRYDLWRLIHIAVGALILAVLFVHTGLHLGVNLNLALMLSFLGLLCVGALAGGATAIEHRLAAKSGPTAAAKPRSLFTWLHILTLWPLPLLLGLHVLTVYFY